MLKKILTLGLGIVLSANLMVPTMAMEAAQDENPPVQASKDVQKDKFDNCKKIRNLEFDKEAKPLTDEEHLARIQEKLDRLDQEYADGKIDEEKYNQLKEQCTKFMEAIKNGEVPDKNFKERFKKQKQPLDKEDMIELLNDKLDKVKEKFDNGDITEEQYNNIKAMIEENIEKVNNGEKINFRGCRKFKNMREDFKGLSNEEKIEKLTNLLEELKGKLEEGNISQDRYDDIKERIEQRINNIQDNENSNE
ncbi:hypothetical protein SH1V18_41140 [Vallitalea longa]|uniref:SHOCT domain-containing protein n=1 Tax=Vallitalea longa TaxID=2936439 RepID=A0A9W5YEK8_9FIRM|nr:hypothetical protein [Vallitalea longa]GKX31634.1 hypothetical protein SH1V18_41140 [Vallitalea longa]